MGFPQFHLFSLKRENGTLNGNPGVTSFFTGGGDVATQRSEATALLVHFGPAAGHRHLSVEESPPRSHGNSEIEDHGHLNRFSSSAAMFRWAALAGSSTATQVTQISHPGGPPQTGCRETKKDTNTRLRFRQAAKVGVPNLPKGGRQTNP